MNGHDLAYGEGRKGEAVETWQIVMYVVGAVLLILYFKRRSDRLSRGE